MSNSDWDDNEQHEAGNTQECERCGGEEWWCPVCNVFTAICCIPYGTCMCS